MRKPSAALAVASAALVMATIGTSVAVAIGPENFADFLAVRDRLDPDRVFTNDYLDRVLGR